MKLIIRISILLLLSFLFLSGCVFFKNLAKQFSKHDERAGVSEKYYEKALEMEQADEFLLALYYLDIADSLNPESQEIIEKINSIKTDVGRRVQQHYENGVKFFNISDYEKAKREFLIVLRLDPDHSEAFDYLKNRLNTKKMISYKVKKGDSFKTIARKVYNNPDKEGLVSHLYKTKNGNMPIPGTQLQLPVLDSNLVKLKTKTTEKINETKNQVIVKAKQVEVKTLTTTKAESASQPSVLEVELIKARQLLENKEYEQGLKLVELICNKFPGDNDAITLRDSYYYEIGANLFEKKRYLKAREALSMVPAGYKDIEFISSELQKELERQAELHYRKGVKHFVNEELKRAISEWELTLTLNPNHKKAEEDIENAKKLLEKLEGFD